MSGGLTCRGTGEKNALLGKHLTCSFVPRMLRMESRATDGDLFFIFFGRAPVEMCYVYVTQECKVSRRKHTSLKYPQV